MDILILCSSCHKYVVTNFIIMSPIFTSSLQTDDFWLVTQRVNFTDGGGGGARFGHVTKQE